MVILTDQLILKSFRGKRVLITGHTGFKGSWLSYILYNLGAKVTGYSLPSIEDNSHFNLLELSKLINHHEGDIRDMKKLKQIFEISKPEFVFHLAAQALVKESYTDPIKTFTTNLSGSINILELVRLSSTVKSFVFVTSDKCYENKEWVWGYRENDQLGGYDPYSASKAAAEIIFSAYLRSYFNQKKLLGTASTRAGNVIGGGDWANDRIVPDCIKSILENRTIELRNPDATRPWQHVLEPLNGYLLLSSKLYTNPKKYSGSWNFGPNTDQVLSVSNITKFFIEYFGRGNYKNVLNSNPNNHEAQLLQLNCDKANINLAWHPRWNVSKTLEMTAKWYKKIDEGENAREITLNQINEFFEFKKAIK